jgi:nitrite reductase/ring-hydroxylating ferredoxin subunit
MGAFMRVTDTADVKPGHGIVAEVNGKTLAVFNVEGTFYALDNTCTHRGGPLGEGELEESIVTCPWHGWQYDGGFKFQVQRVNDGAVAHRLPGA